MDLTPNSAAVLEVGGNLATQLVQVRQRPIAAKIPKLHRPTGAVELEPSLAAFPERMNVRRGMVIRVHGDAVPSAAMEDGRHGIPISQNLTGI
jgi:hypothetical protein